MKAPSRGEWILWVTPLVALSPLLLSHVTVPWPREWRLDLTGEDKRASSCQSNLKQLGLALLQYSQDYDEKFPPATIGGLGVGDQPIYLDGDKVTVVSPPVGWTGAMLPYSHSQELQFCPSQDTRWSQSATPSPKRSPTSHGFTDYWINARITRRAVSTLSYPAQTFLLGEGNDGRDASNATYSKSGFVQSWMEDASSPMFRHEQGANYLFADGHAKWMQRDETAPFGLDLFAP